MGDEHLVAAFMKATGCGHEEAFDRLARCGGHLGRAMNSFFSIDAGPSAATGSRARSPPPPPPSPQVSVPDSSSSSSSEEEEEEAARARPVVPARPTPTSRVSRCDSETKFGKRSKSSRRRERRRRNRRDRSSRGGGTAGTAGGDRAAAADGGGNHSRRRRFREFREDIFSDGEEDLEEGNNSPRRRRLNPPAEHTSEGEKKKAAADDNHGRRRRFREDIFSDGEDDDEEIKNSPRRRRLNPPTETTELTSDSESEHEKKKSASTADDDSRHRFRDDDVITVSSSDDDMLEELDEAPRRPPPPPQNTRFEDLFKVPRDLTFKGGFHDAKAHAARRQRWLLVNVQSFADTPLPSLHQNRDVWGNALVARCVTDRFVLWQADTGGEADGEGEEARKVVGYYDIPHDRLPVVVVVDPVTGQAMDVLYSSAACELNDFMVRLGPFTETKPEIPVVMAKKLSSISNASVGAQSKSRPATTSTTTTTTAPMSSERAAGSRQPQAAPTTTTVMRKQPDAVVPSAAAAAAHTCRTRQEQAPTMTTTAVTEPAVAPCTGQQPVVSSSVEEKVCKVRVRLADGRVVTKEFGSQCTVAALFAYCRSMLDAGGAPPEKTFRLLRFVGRATEEIGDQNASFESLGLHLTTVSVHLG